MSKIRIIPTQLEVKYRGLLIPFSKIKKIVGDFVSERYLNEFVIFKTFNSSTGEIDRKYAWDSIIYKLNEDGYLEPILDSILSNEEAE